MSDTLRRVSLAVAVIAVVALTSPAWAGGGGGGCAGHHDRYADSSYRGK
jgi:hypothetical protein